MTNYGCIDVFQNITDTCSYSIVVAAEECTVDCIISIMNGIKLCSDLLFDVGLLTQLKDVVKHCVYNKYIGGDGH